MSDSLSTPCGARGCVYSVKWGLRSFAKIRISVMNEKYAAVVPDSQKPFISKYSAVAFLAVVVVIAAIWFI